MVSIDSSIYIQIANFLVLILILNIVLFKPIRNILRQRREKVTGIEQNINTLSSQAGQQDQAYKEGIREIRVKGQKEKEALIQSASEEERQIITRITEQAQTEMADVKAKISEETHKVRQALQTQVDSFAEAITQKILGRAV
jgi:F-type H+-transporting ATPase subunit b